MINRSNKHEQEKSLYIRIQDQVKKQVFEIIYQVLREEEISIYHRFILIFIEFFQILYFDFTSINKLIWQMPKVCDSIEKFFGIFLIYPYLSSEQSWNTYIIIFYILILIIIFTICLMFYTSLAQKKTLHFQWPIIILKYLCIYINSILYVPIVHYLANILNCSELIINNNKEEAHSKFNETLCWTGLHILHSFIGVFFISILSILNFSLLITFFDRRMNSNDPNAKLSGQTNYSFGIYKLLIIIIFVFMNNDQFSYLLLALILGGSILIFQRVHFHNSYINEKINKLWDCLASIQLWTAICLIASKLMEQKIFQGTLLMWIIGIPFLVIYICTSRDQNLNFLLSNINKFANGEELIIQICELQKLIRNYKIDAYYTAILDGYVEIHKQNCQREDCPIVVKNNLKINRIIKQIQANNQNDIQNEKHCKLIHLVYTMFLEGVKKFPNNTNLRILFTFFLIEKMKFKQTALHELNVVEENSPPFDIQFTIFHLKKLIEEEIKLENKLNKQKHGNNDEEAGVLDIISEIRYKEILKQFKYNIEICSEAHMDFWSQLSEETPDMQKLHQFGKHIIRSKAKVENCWNKLIKICNKRPQPYLLYSNFLFEILHDNQYSRLILNQANLLQKNTRKNLKNIQTAPNASLQQDDQESDIQATLSISTESDKLGLITQINVSAASLFGYNKTELINRKINSLMPSLYGTNHDNFIENYLNNNEFTFFKEEKHLFLLHKSNYIIPIFISVKSVESLQHGLQLIGHFRPDKQYRNQCYLIIDDGDNINSISASCVNILQIDHKILHVKDKKVDSYLQGLMTDKDKYFAKQGSLFNYALPKEKTNYHNSIINGHLKKYKVFLQNISFKNKHNAGHIIRIECSQEQVLNLNQRTPIPCTFQFIYDNNQKIYNGQYTLITNDFDQSEQKKQECLQNNQVQGQDIFIYNPNIRQTLYHQICQKYNVAIRGNYDKGISTRRLFKNKITDINQFKDSESEHSSNEEDDFNDSLFKNNGEDGEEGIQLTNNFGNSFNSKKSLNQIINSQIVPTAIQNLNILVKIMLLILTIISFVEYFITNQELNQTKDLLQLINYSNKRVANLHYIQANLRDLCLINLGLINSSKAALLKADTLKIIDEIDQLSNYLQLNTSNATSKELKNILYENIIKIYLKTGNTENHNLNDSTQQMISNALVILNTQLNQIQQTNQDFIFYQKNVFNDYLYYIRESNYYYVKELEAQTTNKTTTLFVLLLLSPIFICIMMVVLSPVLINLNQSNLEVINLFLAIPNKHILSLHIQSQSFISQLRADDEDLQSVNDFDREYDEENQQQDHEKIEIAGESGDENFTRRKKKKFVNRIKNSSFYIVSKMFFGVLVLEVYFIICYFMADNLLDNIKNKIPELNYTNYAEGYYIYADNCQRNLFLNPQMPILNQSPLQVSIYNINQIFKLDSDILYDHSRNIQIHKNIYNDEFKFIMTQNPCSFFLEASAITQISDCNIFANGAVQSGMTVAFTRYFENIRQMLTFYQQIMDDDNDFDFQNIAPSNFQKKNIFPNNPKLNDVYNLLAIPLANEIRDMQNIYIKSALRRLVYKFQLSIDESINTLSTVKFVLFITFLFMVFIIYFLFWWPIADKLTEDIWKTRSLLTTVPLNVIKVVKPIQIYIKFLYDIEQKEQMKKQNKENAKNERVSKNKI
ncbi:PAS domain S-box family protein [Ichthyophthirius multifiliis]|uniref:PAS domain S-box family protein n=1 Tax=Ichthyophthirius multifiliis TaxID=5932 RepID=G0QY54_ICHMU|nr:PAS domain S-box family protein [Ichthyophthirius multifiliis]EGR29851.1 PAS domain S-box family protein [Ichthyophthirius multifiliis]|eukprot:XP_004031087.1 PAS domain S-box family protein [Ichthyophthirius multifiliis]